MVSRKFATTPQERSRTVMSLIRPPESSTRTVAPLISRPSTVPFQNRIVCSSSPTSSV
jgi:hypothetical protein